MTHEIDLIPADYRAGLRLRHWGRRLGVAYLALALGIGGARVALAYEVRSREAEIERLAALQAAAREQRERVTALEGRKGEIERQLRLMEGLRGGIDAKRMFVAMARALDRNVWFLDWSFRRAGSLVDSEPEAVETGYFIVVPPRSKKERKKAWLLETHMEVQARAVDHSSLANFVSRLVEQPEIETVRVLRTRVRPYTTTEVVEFELAIVVRTGA